MNVKVEDISSIKKKLSFEVAAERVDTEIEKAYPQNRPRTPRSRGFAPGRCLGRCWSSTMAPRWRSRSSTG